MPNFMEQPHIIVRTTTRWIHVIFSNIWTTTLYQSQWIIHHTIFKKSEANITFLRSLKQTNYIVQYAILQILKTAITNDKLSRQHQQPFLPELYRELHKCMKWTIAMNPFWGLYNNPWLFRMLSSESSLLPSNHVGL